MRAQPEVARIACGTDRARGYNAFLFNYFGVNICLRLHSYGGL